MRTFVLAAIVAILALASPAIAQETRGSITGTIKDTTGGVLPGVTVEATLAGAATQSTVTDARGVYRFPALTPGTYSIKASLSSFQPVKQDDVKVGLGYVLTIDLTLQPGGMSEAVEVTAAAPMIDVKQSAVTSVVGPEAIETISKTGTGILGALSGLPGAGNEGRLGGFGIDGAGASENRYIIDGMDISQLQNGTLGKDLNISFVDTIQVKSSGYAAEYRAATGGVVSAVTKSGTNKFHGEINEYLSGEPLKFLRGDVRQVLQQVPTDLSKAEYYTPLQDKQTTSNPSVSVGGPVMQNKMWFYAGYNPQWSRTIRNVTWTTPASFAGQSQSFDSKSTGKMAVYNASYQLSSNMKVRFNGNNERTTGGLGLPNFTASNGTSNSNATTFNPRPTTYTKGFNDVYSGNFDWTLSTSSFLSVQSGVLTYGSHSAGGDYYHGVRRTFSGTSIGYLDVPPNLQQASGYADNNPNVWTAQNDFSRFTVNTDYTKFFEMKGQHSFKAGIQLERFGNTLNYGHQDQNVTINWNASRATLSGQSVRGKYGYYMVERRYTTGDIHSNNIGFFVQDSWTPNAKLTVNYGVRSDQTNIPSYRPENPGIKFSFADKIAPRVGFAYDLTGNGNWKTYGSFGTFYDIEKLEGPLGSFGAQRWVQYYWTLDDYNWPAISCDGLPGSNCPGTFIEQNDLRHVANGQGADNLVDPNLKPYKSAETTFGVDHQLTRSIVVGARYTHKWILEGIEDVGVAVPGVGEVFYLANPGEGLGQYPLGTNYPATPEARRLYDGLELRFNRRLQNNWSLNANLLISRTWGNYSGLTSSDESGRNSPGVNRFFDGLAMSFDQHGNPTYDRLQSDRPFVLKLQPTYIMPWGTVVSAEADLESGLLQSTTVTYSGVPVFVYGRNDLGRTPVYSYVNLNFQQRFSLGKGMRATVGFDILNLFDQDTVTSFGTGQYRDAMTFPQCAGLTGTAGSTCSNNAFFAGFDTKAIMAANNAANSGTGRPNPTYGMDSGYQGFRTARLQLKFEF